MIDVWVACLVVSWLCLSVSGVGCLVVGLLGWIESHQDGCVSDRRGADESSLEVFDELS